MQETAAYLVFFLMKTSMVQNKNKGKRKNKKKEKRVRQEAVAFHSTSKPEIVFRACVNQEGDKQIEEMKAKVWKVKL